VGTELAEKQKNNRNIGRKTIAVALMFFTPMGYKSVQLTTGLRPDGPDHVPVTRGPENSSTLPTETAPGNTSTLPTETAAEKGASA